MYVPVVVSLFLVFLSLAWTDKASWKGTKPLRECQRQPDSDKIQLEYLELFPECTKDYCRVIPGKYQSFSARFTPKIMGKDLRASLYAMNPGKIGKKRSKRRNRLDGWLEARIAQEAIMNSIRTTKLYEVSLCDKMRFNITCPYKAGVPLYAFFNGTLDVKFPAPMLQIQIALQDGMHSELICYTFKIKVENETMNATKVLKPV